MMAARRPLPICGDGLRNAAANEACDTVDDTVGCDRDCTPPVCGDNLVNGTVEDCEDSSTTNGCGADCKFNSICGNGIVESAVEFCDPGPTASATCNADCTIAFCGDHHVNPRGRRAARRRQLRRYRQLPQ
jgi:hypothetical protein